MEGLVPSSGSKEPKRWISDDKGEMDQSSDNNKVAQQRDQCSKEEKCQLLVWP